jgi:AraC family transcriptional regulator
MSSPPGQFLGAVTHRRSALDWTVTDLRHARPNRFPAHAHRWTCLTVLLGGEYAERIEARWHQRAVNSLIIRPALAPHADRVGAAGAWFLNIEVSDAFIARRSDRDRPLAEWMVVPTLEIVAIGWRLLRELHRAEAADAAVLEGYIAALMAELTVEPDTRQPPRWLTRALEMMQDGRGAPISIDLLARECGVHPAHLTRVFRRHLGQTVGTYARALRLRAAMELLVRGGATMAEAGHGAGFHDESHLSRTMRAVTGLTPGQYRRLIAPGGASAASRRAPAGIA